MNHGLTYKAIRNVAIFIVGGASAFGLYTSYNSNSPTIAVLDSPTLNNFKTKEQADVSCENLENHVVKHMKIIIKNGQIPPKTDPIFQNFSSNLAAMKLHKCDKDALYTYLDNTLTLDDPLYFELNEIL